MLVNVCLATFAWELSLGSVGLGISARRPSPETFRFQIRSSRLDAFSKKCRPGLSLGNVRFGMFAWELRLGTSVSLRLRISLGIFRMTTVPSETFAKEL